MLKSNLKQHILLNLTCFLVASVCFDIDVKAENIVEKSDELVEFNLNNIELKKENKKYLEVEKKLKSNFIISQNGQEEIYIKSVYIDLEKVSVLESEILALIQPYQEQNVTFEELEKLADQITELYLSKGYINSRAAFVDIDQQQQLAIIEVFEGEIEEVQLEGDQRLGNYVRQRIGVASLKPFNSGELEDQLRLLKANPLFENVEASLKKGSQERSSILVVKVTEANPFYGSFGFDNYSPPSIGSTQMTLNLGHRNVFGLGDAFSVSYRPRLESFTGTYNLDLAYSVPLNPMNGTIQAIVSLQENEVIQGAFKDLEISGESEYYELTYRQPLIRNPRQEFALSLGMSYRDGQTFTFQGPTPFGLGPDEDGVSRTNVITFGQDYTLRQPTGAWGMRSQFRFGTGIFSVTDNPDPIPDGHFFSWLGQIQRVQVLNEDNFLIIQADIQLTPDPLLPSEQFAIGGGQSIRGYRQNVRSGDNGFRFSIEDRMTLVRNDEQDPLFQLAPFFDMGTVWNSGDNPNIEPDQRFIAGLGLGVIWQPIDGLNMRLDYAPPLIYIDDKGDNVQDSGFYFNVKYNF